MRTRVALVVALAALVAAALAVPGLAAQGTRFRPAVSGNGGVVATESLVAARVGRSVLERGGNAMDAAVATVFAMGVARPQSCGLGGGGFLVYRPGAGHAYALDFRETAPAATKPDQFVGPGLHKSFTGHLTVGVPGTVAGMAAALDRFGTWSWRRVLGPAERLARNGVTVSAALAQSMDENADRLTLFPAAAAQFLLPGFQTPYPGGSKLVQPTLAATIRRLQRGGPDAFYEGTIARMIVADMQARRPTDDPGVMTLEDLKGYEAKWRTPLLGSYRGAKIIAMPPPTSGGIAILEMLNLLKGFDLKAFGQSSADELHVLAEAQKLAFADRNAYVADPDQINVPTGPLTSQTYADSRRPEITLDRAHTYRPGLGDPATAAPPANPITPARESTTQISIIDRRNNAVSVTCTIEQEFGSAVVAPGTGFLLNNELTDFSDPGNVNEPRPGKRPRSSMSPTIVVKDKSPILVTGGAGGIRIVEGTLMTIVNVLDYGLDIAHAVDAERLNEPGSTLELEDGRLAPGVVDELVRRGHNVLRKGDYDIRPRVQAAGVVLSDGSREAVSDPRSEAGSLIQRPAGVGVGLPRRAAR